MGSFAKFLDRIFIRKLAIANIAALWSMAYSARTGHIDFSSAPRYWGRLIPLMPRLLFQTINLPV